MIDKAKHCAGKLFSFALIIVFVALGVVGILLPILPGLLFLFIAGLIAARHFPPLAFVMERNSYSRRALRISNSFMDLDWWDKAKLCFWGTIKLSIDTVVWGIELVKKGGRYAASQIRGR